MPTLEQLRSLYQIGYRLTYVMLQPIHLICIDQRSRNLFILAGHNEGIEFEMTPTGQVVDEPS